MSDQRAAAGCGAPTGDVWLVLAAGPVVRPSAMTTGPTPSGCDGACLIAFVGSVSEVRPLSTEEYLTDESIGVDDTSGVEAKRTTTVAMDFGRITLNESLLLYLFGTPGQDRFWYVWDELALGAIGAIVL